MTIFNAIAVALGLFALIRYPLLSVARKRWQQYELSDRRKKWWWIALLEQAADLCLTAAITFSCIAIFLLLVDLQTGNSLAQMNAALTRLDGLRKVLIVLKNSLNSTILFFSFIVFTFLWLRTGKRYFEDKFDALVREEIAKLQHVLRDTPEQWKTLEPSLPMRRVLTAIHELQREQELLRPEQPGYDHRLEELKQRHQYLKTIFVNLDFERRINFPWQIPLPTAQTLSERIRNIFLSKGFLSDIKRAGKMLKYATMAAAFAGLLAFKGPAVVNAVDEKIAKLDELRVSNSLEQTTKLRNQAVKREEEQAHAFQESSSLSPKQAHALQAFARDSVRSFAGNRVWPHASRGAEEEVRRSTLRLAILDETRSTTAPWAEATAEERNASAPFVSYAESAATPEAKRAAEDAIIQDISSLPPGTRERTLDSVVLWFEKRYGMEGGSLPPVDANELQGTFVESFFNAILPDSPSSTGEVGKYFRDVVGSGVKTAARNGFQVARNLIVLRLQNEDPQQVIDSLRTEETFSFLTRADSIGLNPTVSIYKDQPNTNGNLVKSAQREIARATIEPITNENAASILKEYPPELRKGKETELANLLASFETEFPHQGAAVSEAAREKVLSAWGIADTNGVEARAERALNFDSLQSYSRVGGILFGRDPKGDQLDVPEFWWEINNDKLALYVRERGAKTSVNIGEFRPYLIWQALAYVADQRPTVVTLLSASSLGGGLRQVMIHPAFRDTALGCRLLQADRWIFHYTDPKPNEPNSTIVRKRLNELEVATDLYSSAWEVIQNNTSENKYKDAKSLSSYLPGSDLTANAELPGVQPELMRLAEECGISQQKSFPECVRQRSDGANWKAQLPTTKPRFGFVSQIREASYSVGPDLAFLNDAPVALSGAPPLEMTVQMTINDNNRWEFPNFAKNDLPSVIRGLSADGKTPELRELQELTRLQRFFRAAIQGYMGSSFPAEKFVSLAAVAKSMDTEAPVHTPRWLKERGEMETPEADLAKAMQTDLKLSGNGKVALTEHVNRVAAKVRICARFLGDPSNEGRSNDEMMNACPWQDIAEDTRDECRAKLHSADQLENVIACRIFAEAHWGEDNLAVLHALRLSLGAANARSADDLACPAPH